MKPTSKPVFNGLDCSQVGGYDLCFGENGWWKDEMI
jgi:hypothetical protein